MSVLARVRLIGSATVVGTSLWIWMLFARHGGVAHGVLGLGVGWLLEPLVARRTFR